MQILVFWFFNDLSSLSVTLIYQCCSCKLLCCFSVSHILFLVEMVSMMNPMVYVRNQPEAPASEQPKQANMMGFPFQQGIVQLQTLKFVSQHHSGLIT